MGKLILTCKCVVGQGFLHDKNVRCDFDDFPMLSPGKRLVRASNRNGETPHEINIFIADWVE